MYYLAYKYHTKITDIAVDIIYIPVGCITLSSSRYHLVTSGVYYLVQCSDVLIVAWTADWIFIA